MAIGPLQSPYCYFTLWYYWLLAVGYLLLKMGFINGAFLWLAGAVSVPIIIHLLYKRRYKRVDWAATRFLKRALRQTRKRIRLEHLLLLLLRTLIILFIVLAISKPFVKQTLLASTLNTPTSYYLVIDNTMSMSYKYGAQTFFERAKELAINMLDELNTGSDDRFYVITLNRYPRVYPELVRKESVKRLIQDMSISHSGGDALATFVELKRLLDRTHHSLRKVYIITDYQRQSWQEPATDQKALGALLEELSGDEKNQFYILDVGRGDLINSSVVALKSNDTYIVSGSRAIFTAHIFNFSSRTLINKEVSFYVGPNKIVSKKVDLEPNKVSEVNFDYIFNLPGSAYVKCVVEGDNLIVDNTRYLSINVYESINVLIIDGEPAGGWDGESGFIREILEPGSDVESFFKVKVITPIEFSEEDLTHYDLIFILNVSYLASGKIDAIEDFVKNGRSVFISLGPNYKQELYGGGISRLLPAEVSELIDTELTRTDAFIRDVNSQYLSMLRGKEIEFSGVKLRKFFGVKQTKDSKSLLSVDYLGRLYPLLLFRQSGLGKIFLYVSSVDDEWSRFCFNPLFPLTIYNCVELMMEKPFSTINYYVGDNARIILPVALFDSEFIISADSGEYTINPKLSAGTDDYFYLYYPQEPSSISKSGDRTSKLKEKGLDEPGIYSVYRKSDRRKPVRYFASNLLPKDDSLHYILGSESNLERIDSLKTMFPGFNYVMFGSGEESLKSSMQVSNLWRPFLYLVLILMLAEFLFAFYIDRGKAV